MRSKVKVNGKGIEELLHSDEVRAVLEAKALNVLAAAERTAPYVSGDYQASLRVEEATTDRAVARVVADVDYAWAVEANTGNLSRALGHA